MHLLGRNALASFFLVLAGFSSIKGQNIREPEPVPLPPPIPAPVDRPYPGVIDLTVDATDVQRRIVNVRETIPVQSTDFTLLYPEWIPGNHSPTGPISAVAGLNIRADGKPVEWVRDWVNVYAFHVSVPTGAKSLEIEFQFLAPQRPAEGRISISSQIADLQWNTMLLYPAGHFARDIRFTPTLKIPTGWQFASALEADSHSADSIRFKTVPLNRLIDSPVYAGINYKRVDVSTGPDNPVFLDIFGDTAKDVAISPEQIRLHKNLTEQAQKLFASHHYNHYDFLFLLSDVVGGIGLEHHQSSEDGTRANYFTDWPAGVMNRDLLAHEYAHSWNGKFRRPAGLWTPNFNVPMHDELLWVYEGMTQYFGYVLTARAGLRTPEQTRDLIAGIAANFEASPGREWRPLVDTTNQPTISQRRAVSWVSWQRPEDYYTEGMLIWFDADTKIRELSSDRKSLDEFTKLFFGMDNGSFVTQTYTFDDVVRALNAVQPYDWATFLKQRVYEIAPKAPENGIRQGGYRLIYNDTQPQWQKDAERPESPESATNFGTSIGFAVRSTGEVTNVWWNSAAFKAGVTPGMQITAINGTAFKTELLRNTILDAEKNQEPIKLLVKRDNQFQTIDVDYHGGLRYPHLERVENTPDRLDAILAAK
jgi:predicted metalloprotease with PDZ domain